MKEPSLIEVIELNWDREKFNWNEYFFKRWYKKNIYIPESIKIITEQAKKDKRRQFKRMCKHDIKSIF